MKKGIGNFAKSILIMIFWPKITHCIPGSLIEIIVSTLLIYFFKLSAETIGSCFGEIPATGAIASTATNIKNGGRTPVAGIVHAITLLLIMLFFGKLAKLIPMATLAAILVIVSYNMSEWRSFKSLLKSPRSDVIVLLTTFLLTVIFDLTIAIQIGMILAVILFMRRMVMVTNVCVITRELVDEKEIYDPNAISKERYLKALKSSKLMVRFSLVLLLHLKMKCEFFKNRRKSELFV